MKATKAMKANTLDEKQRNKTLSAKTSAATKKTKRKIKTTTRPVLAEPKSSFDNEFELSESQCTELQIKMLIYYEHKPLPVPKWCDLKKYSKEERKQIRKPEKIEIPSRAYIALGFNEVSRSLENKTAKIVISAHAFPEKLLLKSIRQTCDIYNIPFLLVNNFREISKQCFGFSSMMMALKDVPSDTKIYQFYEFLLEKYCKVDKPIIEETAPTTSNELITSHWTAPMETEELIEIEENECETVRNIYIYRNNSTKRSFIPQPIRETKTFNADFISFGNEHKEDTAKISVPYPSTNDKTRTMRKLRILKLKSSLDRIKKNKGTNLR